ATAGLGLAPEWHFISAAAITLAGWLFLLRRRRQLLSSAPAPLDADAGATVEILYWQDARHARVRYRGTEWDARLSSRIRPATDCHFEIVRLDGNTLIIRAVEE
ncbi:NfeD family protein, partial [Laribacter hongkongensis]